MTETRTPAQTTVTYSTAYLFELADAGDLGAQEALADMGAERPAQTSCPTCETNDVCGIHDYEDDAECLGHETTSGPIGSTVYCDGTCR